MLQNTEFPPFHWYWDFSYLKTFDAPLMPNHCVLLWNTYRNNYLELWSKHDFEFIDVYKSFSSVIDMEEVYLAVYFAKNCTIWRKDIKGTKISA